jgi:hypothetical protein
MSLYFSIAMWISIALIYAPIAEASIAPGKGAGSSRPYGIPG